MNRGVHAASTHEDLIRQWWRHCPTANVAISPWRSGLVVLDVDRKRGSDGFETLQALECDLGPLPETTTARTPHGGGEHRYYLAPSVPVDSSSGQLGGLETPGLDVRARGGYVVAPPSTIDGRPYTWTRRVRPVELPPAWVELLTVHPRRERAGANVSTSPTVQVGQLRSDRYAAAAIDGECSDVAATPPGRRNHTLIRAAFNLGQLVGSGDLDEDVVRERLLEAASEAGLPRRESLRTIRSGLRAGIEQPRERGAA